VNQTLRFYVLFEIAWRASVVLVPYSFPVPMRRFDDLLLFTTRDITIKQTCLLTTSYIMDVANHLPKLRESSKDC